MKYVRSIQFLLAFFALSGSLYAQAWSGILSTSRAANWSQSGVVGGIPNRTTLCTTIKPGATAAQINSAISSCPSGEVVSLTAGTYNLTAGLVMKGGVTLRGAGANQTSLVFTGNNSCGGLGADVCFMDSVGWYYGSTAIEPGGTYSATWSGGYSQGATSISLSKVGSSGITNGQYIALDQVNDNTVTSTGLIVCNNTTTPCSLEGGGPGRCSVGQGGSACTSGILRNQIQFVKVVSGCSSVCSGAGPFTITITPGLYAKNWRSSQSPGAWWSSSTMQNAGIENLSLDHSNSPGANSGIYFNNAFNCWVSGVRSLRSVRNHVWLWQSAHITVQNSYFYGTQNAAEESYGVESFIGGDSLVINNIFQQVTAPFVFGPSQGSVFLYNFDIDNPFSNSSTWLQQSFAWNHDAGVLYNLMEGNVTSGFWGDVFHGTGGINTAFRNYAVGWGSGKSSETVAIVAASYNRFENIIGNVLGCNNNTSSFPGNCGTPYHTTYQSSLGPGVSKAIYAFGAGNTESGVTVPSDSYVSTSSLRWGNYDVSGAAVRWNSSEVPSGLTDGYANPVPSNHTLPASFYNTTKPAWWPSAKAWPFIGPEVTGGNIPGVGGHAYSNPAQDCYTKVMRGPADGTGNALMFNAVTCYPGSSPAPPANVTASPH